MPLKKKKEGLEKFKWTKTSCRREMLRLGPPRAVLQSAISCSYSISIPAQLCENICSLTNYTSSWETNWNKKPTERNSMDWNTLNNFADFCGPMSFAGVLHHIIVHFALWFWPCPLISTLPPLCVLSRPKGVSIDFFQPGDQELRGEKSVSLHWPCVELPHMLFYVHLFKKITPLIPMKTPLYGT